MKHAQAEYDALVKAALFVRDTYRRTELNEPMQTIWDAAGAFRPKKPRVDTVKAYTRYPDGRCKDYAPYKAVEFTDEVRERLSIAGGIDQHAIFKAGTALRGNRITESEYAEIVEKIIADGAVEVCDD